MDGRFGLVIHEQQFGNSSVRVGLVPRDDLGDLVLFQVFESRAQLLQHLCVFTLIRLFCSRDQAGSTAGNGLQPQWVGR